MATYTGTPGNDDIDIGIQDTRGANPVTTTAWGFGGNDTISLTYFANGLEIDWVGQQPTGTIRLYGGAGDDTVGVYGSFDTWSLNMAGTTVYLYGGAGNDQLDASSHDPNSDGSPYRGNNTDLLYGGPGNDSYFVLETKDTAIEKAGEGYDTVEARSTDYTLGPNIEKLVLSYNYLDFPGPAGHHGTGNALANVIVGSDQNDTLDGLAGNDTIYGSDFGGDIGMPDEDLIRGGAGNDLIYGGGGEESNALEGADEIYGDAGNDRIFGQYGDDALYGGAGNDSLAGQAGNDTLWGGAGNDHLGGGTGNDTLYGEDGADVLTGREGADTLGGGGDNDRFVYEAIVDSKAGAGNRDTILDMAGIGGVGGDRIDLAQIDADATKAGNQAFAFVSSAAVLKAGQVHVVAGGGSNSFVQGEVDGKAGVDFEILVHDGATGPGDWVAGDFIL